MWLLYQFQTSRGTIVTRGRNSAEAKKCIQILHKGISIFSECSYCNVTAAYQYSENHPFDWLNSPPRWLNIVTPWLPDDPKFKNRFYKTPA